LDHILSPDARVPCYTSDESNLQSARPGDKSGATSPHHPVGGVHARGVQLCLQFRLECTLRRRVGIRAGPARPRVATALALAQAQRTPAAAVARDLPRALPADARLPRADVRPGCVARDREPRANALRGPASRAGRVVRRVLPDLAAPLRA